MSKTAFIFPGQGAQYVGMGKDLYDALAAARVVFDQAEEITGLPIKQLCFDGPDADLARTDHAQPCIFTHSAAVLATMDDLLDGGAVAALKPAYMAGLSLGEYTALYAAGMISFADALTLVTKRGAAMQAAAEARPSSMVAVMGLDDEAAANNLCEAAAEGQILTPANFNCPGQIVLSGETEACQRAADKAADFGARGATVLNVAGAFHSELMAPAAEQIGQAIEGVSFNDAGAATVLANVDAAAYSGPADAKDKLLAQLTGAVRWQQCCEVMLADGVETFYEIGPGKILSGLMRRIDRKANVERLNGKDGVEKLAGVPEQD
ncbi:MAG: ACP S-malonyltransferase [Planctomycetes bacterium]|nr:ACP S-malonyltransferase [Planctomycetota bacterium]